MKNYSIYKDDLPKNTVIKIKQIFNQLEFDISELFIPNKIPISLRVHLKDKINIGANGKGTSVENATASAYAEFIERIQNSLVINFLDNISFLKKDILETESILKNYNKSIQKYFNKYINLFIKNNILSKEEITFLEFYNLKEKKIYNLPYSVIKILDGSNGMSAGNTFEEALVQGISEICERYSMKKILSENISIPNINPSYYMEYANIRKIIDYYNEIGYQIIVKDASLGGVLPCVCTVVLNKKKNIMNVLFASHTNLIVAIERTLTEFAQGLDIEKYYIEPASCMPIISNNKFMYISQENIFLSVVHRQIAFEINDILKKQFLENNDFSSSLEDSFLFDNSIKTNKELLSFMVDKVSNISSEIYVRNNAFLGFPTVKIFIPNISETYRLNTEMIKNIVNSENWTRATADYSNQKLYNINTLCKYAEFSLFFLEKQVTGLNTVFDVPFEYVAILCSIVLKNYKKFKMYFDILIGQNKYEELYTEEQIKIFEIIKMYFELLETNDGISQEKIKENLKLNYIEDDVTEAIEIFNNLNFEEILDIVLKDNRNYYSSDSSVLKNKLIKQYVDNIPDQSVFEKILN